MSNKVKISDFDEDVLWEGIESTEQVEALVYDYLSLKQELLEKDPEENEEILWSILKVKEYIEENF